MVPRPGCAAADLLVVVPALVAAAKETTDVLVVESIGDVCRIPSYSLLGLVLF